MTATALELSLKVERFQYSLSIIQMNLLALLFDSFIFSNGISGIGTTAPFDFGLNAEPPRSKKYFSTSHFKLLKGYLVGKTILTYLPLTY